MASSSLTSSTQKSFKYDVFINFRGEGTRKNFVDHLYHALKKKGIEAYKDDERIVSGKRIYDQIIQSINESRFFIVVFSKKYASSAWCLDELVKIMECNKMTEHIVYPVFYDVDPTEIRIQSGAVGRAFDKYENEEVAGKWRQALKEASNLPGWDLRGLAYGDKAKPVNIIIEDILFKLHFPQSSYGGILIGMETRLQDLESSLEIGVNDVRMIGIKGMGGAGKTTLARAIFDRVSIQFEAVCFVENVREVSKSSLNGLRILQTQILRNLSNHENITISSVHEGKNIMKMVMLRRKVLIVVDDVDHIDQLQALAGEPNWYKPGSRIIITTRDEQILIAHRVQAFYDVNLLTDLEAISLFSRYAFGRNAPIQGYENLSREFVDYAAGLPLTIRVLGSYMRGRDKHEWKDALERLKFFPLKETLEKLELSYTGLKDDYKEIFLDVACLLKGWDKERAIRMLESCGFPARDGLRVLEQKSMIITTKKNQAEFIDMHRHIEEMGKSIVRRADDPCRHSRLWYQEEIEDILANELGYIATKAIAVDSPVKRCSEIATKGFGSMKKLRLLCIESEADNDCDVKNDELIMSFPSSLICLSWSGYPHLSLPKTFVVHKLVVLELPYSRIKRLWEGGEGQVFHKLKYIDLSYSKLRTHDLGLTPNLEMLNLSECHDLVELHMSIGCLKLRSIKVSHSKLMTLDLRLTLNLEVLELKECHDLVELHMPVECLKLTSLNLSHLKLRNLDLNLTPNLEILSLEECHDLVKFNTHIERMVKLRSLKFSNLKLRSLDLQPLLNLELLKLKECHDLIELHMPVECLNLMSLELNHLKLRTFKLFLAPNLEALKIEGCHDLVELDMPVECLKLKSLELCHSKLRTLDLGLTPSLKTLNIKKCQDLVQLHMSNGDLKLRSLKISHSKLMNLDPKLTKNLEVLKLKECFNLVQLDMSIERLNLRSLMLSHSTLRNLDLGLTPNLETLNLKECHDLEELHMPVRCPKLKSLELSHSKLSTFDLRQTPNLEKLTLEECHDLVELNMMVESPKLRSLKVSNSKLRSLDLVLTRKLELLDLQDCIHLAELHMPTGGLKRLIYLNLSGCSNIKSFLFIEQLESLKVLSLTRLYMKEFPDMIIPRHLDNSLLEFRFRYNDIYELPSSIENYQQLVYLDLHSCRKLRILPGSICSLRSLRNLKLYGCSLEELPEDIGGLECLEKLNLSFTSIKHLPDSICKLKNLKTLDLSSCWNLEKLPEGIGQLECLQNLILTECTQLRDIPDSICMLKELKYLSFLDCIQLQKLPEELGDLLCLEELNIKGTRIRFLPLSISLLTELKICGPKSGIRF